MACPEGNPIVKYQNLNLSVRITCSNLHGFVLKVTQVMLTDKFQYQYFTIVLPSGQAM
jgi:hypothetical protein